MLKRLAIAVALCGPALAGGPALAINSDPCGDIACDPDGTCLACWEENSGEVICEEDTWLSMKLTCDTSDALQLPPQLVAPDILAPDRLDLRTLQPQPPSSAPLQPRDPSPNR